MIKIPLEYHYPIFTLFMFFLVVGFVPKAKVAPLFWCGLFWGFFLSLVFTIVFGPVLGTFHYIKAYPFIFFGSPIWLNVAWIGAILLYLRFLPNRKVWYVFPTYVFFFALASAILDLIFHQIGILVYTGWNPFYRFLAGLGWFYGAARHQWILDRAEIIK